MNNMTVCNYIVGIAGIVLGGLIMNAAAEFPMEFTVNGPGPGFWPFSLGALLLAAAVFLLGYTFWQKENLSQVRVALTTAANRRVYMMMGVAVVFCALISLLGFYPAAFLVILAVMRVMDYRNKKVMLLTAVCTIVFIYIVFGMVLRTQMPESIFM